MLSKFSVGVKLKMDLIPDTTIDTDIGTIYYVFFLAVLILSLICINFLFQTIYTEKHLNIKLIVCKSVTIVT